MMWFARPYEPFFDFPHLARAAALARFLRSAGVMLEAAALPALLAF